MLTKEKVIDSMNGLPDTFSLEEVMERIVVIEKIEKGLEDSKAGNVTPDEEVDKKLSKWLD